jgi:hypothetical protein
MFSAKDKISRVQVIPRPIMHRFSTTHSYTQTSAVIYAYVCIYVLIGITLCTFFFFAFAIM